MSVKCSEVVNYNICQGYYKLISQMFDEEIKYIRNFKMNVNEYFKKVLNLQINLGSKLGQLPDEFANADWLDISPPSQNNKNSSKNNSEADRKYSNISR